MYDIDFGCVFMSCNMLKCKHLSLKISEHTISQMYLIFIRCNVTTKIWIVTWIVWQLWSEVKSVSRVYVTSYSKSFDDVNRHMFVYLSIIGPFFTKVPTYLVCPFYLIPLHYLSLTPHLPQWIPFQQSFQKSSPFFFINTVLTTMSFGIFVDHPSSTICLIH